MQWLSRRSKLEAHHGEELNSFLLLSDLLKWNTFLVIRWCEGKCLGGICGNIGSMRDVHWWVYVGMLGNKHCLLMDSEKAWAVHCVPK